MPPFAKRFLLGAAKWLLLLVVIAAMVIAAEFFVRWFYRDVLSSSSGRDFFYDRSYHLFRKEELALGIRGDFFHIKPNQAMRVVFMGDSFTYGQGVYPQQKRFPEQASVLFKQRYPDIDVQFINIGKPGFNLPQHNRNLAPFILKLEPDFVIYQWYINDMEVKSDRTLVRAPPLIPNKKIHRYLTENSVIYFLMRNAQNKIRVLMGDQIEYHDLLTRNLGDPQSKKAVAANKQLNKLLDQFSKNKIPHGLVLFPDLDIKKTDYKLAYLHQQVLDVCEQRSINCLDLTRAYSEYDDDLSQLWANVFDHHPSALAHRVAAREIVDFFEDEWKEVSTKGRFSEQQAQSSGAAAQPD